MELSWPGMDHWPKVYHFFHYIQASTQISRLLFWSKYFLSFCNLIAVLIFPRNKLISNPKSYFQIIFNKMDLILSFGFIEKNNLADLNCIIAILSLILFLFAYFIPKYLFLELVFKIIPIVICDLPFVLLPSSNYLLQYYIEQYLLTKKCSIKLFYVFSSVLIFSFFMVLNFIFLSRKLSFQNDVIVWDIRPFIKLLFLNCIIVQFWSILPFWPILGSRFIIILNFLCSLYLFKFSLESPIHHQTLKSILIKTGLMLCINTFLSFFLPPDSIKLFIFILIFHTVVTFYILPYFTRHFTNKMKESLHIHQLLRDFSDDGEPVQLPDLPANKAILYLRHILVLDIPDTSEILIKYIENTVDTSLLIEIFRILAVIGELPSLISQQILEIDRSDIEFLDQQLLCDLQFEAIKSESCLQSPTILDELESDIENALIVFSNSLITKDTQNLENSLQTYTNKCDNYNLLIDWTLRNQPLSQNIIEKYSAFLKRFRGCFIESEYWKSISDAMSTDKLPFFSSSTGFEDFIENTPKNSVFFQHYITEDIVSKIESKSFFYAKISLLFVLIVMLLITFCRPMTKILNTLFNDQINLRFALTSHTITLLSKYYLNSTIESLYINDITKLIFSVFMSKKDKSPFIQNWRKSLISHQFSSFFIFQENYVEKILDLNQFLWDFDDKIEDYHEKAVWIFTKIILKLSIPLIIFLIIGVLILIIIFQYCFRKDCSKFISVFFTVEKDSILKFRTNIRCQKETDTSNNLLFDNENLLGNDEIDLDEDDPIQIPIQFLLMNKESSENLIDENVKEIPPLKKFPFYRLIFFIILLFIFVDGITLYKKCQIGRHILEYGQIISISIKSIFKIILCASKTLDVNITSHFIHDLTCDFLNDLERIPDKFRITIENLTMEIKNAIKINNKKTVAKIGFYECPKLIEAIKKHISDESSLVSEDIGFLSYFLSIVNVFLIIAFISSFMIYYRFSKLYFESLKAVLKILPSQYFSSIVSVINKFIGIEENQNQNSIINLETGNNLTTSLSSNKTENRMNDCESKHMNPFGKFLFSKRSSIESNQRMLDQTIVFRRADDALLLLDSNYFIIDVNQQAIVLFHMNKGDITGKHVSTFLPDFSLDKFKSIINNIPVKVTVSAFKCHKKTYIFVNIKNQQEITSLKQRLLEEQKKSFDLIKGILPDPFIEFFEYPHENTQTNSQITFLLDSITIFSIGISNFIEFCGAENVADISNMLFNTIDRKRKKTAGVSRFLIQNGFYYGICGLDGEIDHVEIALSFLKKCISKFYNKFPNIKASLYHATNVNLGLASKKRAVFCIFGHHLDLVKMMQLMCPDGYVVANPEFLDNAENDLGIMWDEIEEQQILISPINNFII
ncbi:hypothetical protein TRFO_38557 [Tritrichomonas foetus]|uniref:Guanylate cyclase domain-containing protein n=1 Tax=Tritrichomonas foetus TaxID=1144522 RepID=A0A1J4JD52_9EUKA|nr:hypothetical protein TRFO_38557 [Tritrichomonas foetus]|eukprot:OHS95341.1 hypothetical protein TRFO_38557 [Tritrichomonas foetus]